MADLKELVIKCPDPEKHRVMLRCVDLCEEIARRYSVNVEKGTVGKTVAQAQADPAAAASISSKEVG